MFVLSSPAVSTRIQCGRNVLHLHMLHLLEGYAGQSLPSLPHLTDLLITERWRFIDAKALTAITACAQLRRLEFVRCKAVDLISTLTRQPGGIGRHGALEQLILREYDLKLVTAADWSALVNTIPRLQSIELAHCPWDGTLITSIEAATLPSGSRATVLTTRLTLSPDLLHSTIAALLASIEQWQSHASKSAVPSARIPLQLELCMPPLSLRSHQMKVPQWLRLFKQGRKMETRSANMRAEQPPLSFRVFVDADSQAAVALM